MEWPREEENRERVRRESSMLYCSSQLEEICLLHSAATGERVVLAGLFADALGRQMVCLWFG